MPIKNTAVKGMNKFLQQPILTEINGGVRIQTTAEIPHPKIEPIIGLITKHAERKQPKDDDVAVISYVKENVKRFKN